MSGGVRFSIRPSLFPEFVRSMCTLQVSRIHLKIKRGRCWGRLLMKSFDGSKKALDFKVGDERRRTSWKIQQPWSVSTPFACYWFLFQPQFRGSLESIQPLTKLRFLSPDIFCDKNRWLPNGDSDIKKATYCLIMLEIVNF